MRSTSLRRHSVARVTRRGLRYEIRRRAEQVVTFAKRTRGGRAR